jgi:hypothetical protein
MVSSGARFRQGDTCPTFPHSGAAPNYGDVSADHVIISH